MQVQRAFPILHDLAATGLSVIDLVFSAEHLLKDAQHEMIGKQMLHELSDEGHMKWMCPCGKENSAHVSHEQVEHPSHDEQESVVEGTFTDDAGRVWTRSISRPTGNKIVAEGVVALPPCSCGARTFLKASFNAADWEDLRNRVDTTKEIPELTDASEQAALRHIAVRQHMQQLGKGPDDIRKGQT
jgi:hypothetical protein